MSDSDVKLVFVWAWDPVVLVWKEEEEEEGWSECLEPFHQWVRLSRAERRLRSRLRPLFFQLTSSAPFKSSSGASAAVATQILQPLLSSHKQLWQEIYGPGSAHYVELLNLTGKSLVLSEESETKTSDRVCPGSRIWNQSMFTRRHCLRLSLLHCLSTRTRHLFVFSNSLPK